MLDTTTTTATTVFTTPPFHYSSIPPGPYFPDDPYDLTTEQYCADSGDLSDDFHTYGLVWSKDEMYTYIDSEDNKVLSVPIDESFW